MLKLLVILLAIDFSSHADGTPILLKESSENTAADISLNGQDVISSERYAEQTDDSAFGEKTVQFHDEQKDIGTSGPEPSLNPRMLGTSKPKDKTSNWGQKMEKKAKSARETIKSRASDCCKPSNSEESDSSSSPQIYASFGPTAQESAALSLMRVGTKSMMKAADLLLSKPDADPYNDEKLSKYIDTVFYLYHVAHNRPLPIFANSDQKSRMSVKLAELAKIFGELGSKTASKRALELSSAYNQQSSSLINGPSSPHKTSSLDLASGFCESRAWQMKKEGAERIVRAVRVLLSDPNGNPYKDKKLAGLVDSALYLYQDIYNPRLQDSDEESSLRLKLVKLRGIWDAMDAKEKKMDQKGPTFIIH